MNWVSSSLQLAGNLLESVDQHAALTLTGAFCMHAWLPCSATCSRCASTDLLVAGDAESDNDDEQTQAQQQHATAATTDDDEGLLSALKTRIAHATDVVSATASSNGGDSADESEVTSTEASQVRLVACYGDALIDCLLLTLPTTLSRLEAMTMQRL